MPPSNARTQKEPSERSTPTPPQRLTERKLRRARLERRVVLSLLGVFLLLGATGFLGDRTATITSSVGGYTTRLTYPLATREGEPVRWKLVVSHPGGFDGQIVIRTTYDYLLPFDITNIHPDPSTSNATDGVIVWGFDPPDGDSFVMTLDASTEPAIHWHAGATTTVTVGGAPAGSLSYSTRILP